jgi:hypothetical protein
MKVSEDKEREMWRKNDSSDIESVKRDIKKIRRAGRNAEILGWLVLASVIGTVWLISTKSDVYILFAVSVLVGLFLVYSGKYVKSGRGRRVRLALLANSIVALPLCAVILPIYVCVQSSSNYYRFKDLPEQIRGLYIERRKHIVSVRDAIFLSLLIIIGIGSFIVRLNHLDKTAGGRGGVSVQAQANAETASDSHFTINFPGAITASTLSEQVSGSTISYTIYASTSNKGSEEYDVYAYSYPTTFSNYLLLAPQPGQATAADTALQSLVKGIGGTPITSDQSTFLGHTTEEAEFTSQTL